MICPFCKEEITDGAIKCKHCGRMLNEKIQEVKTDLKISKNRNGGGIKRTFGIITIVLGFISAIIFFGAASNIKASGLELKNLRSQGGTSVAEAYYQEIGSYGIAYSQMYNALGVGVFAISVGLGGLLLTNKS